MARLCVRPDCSIAAAATMTYDYKSRTVWVDDLLTEAVRGGYDLCLAHADGLGEPQGWTRDDRRTEVVALFSRLAV